MLADPLPLDNTTDCDKEPIHIPGKVQYHGFLLAVDRDFVITHCSENIEKFLGVKAASFLGRSAACLDVYLGRHEPNGFLAYLIRLWNTGKGFEPMNPFPMEIGGVRFNLILSKAADLFLIECEPEISDVTADIPQILGLALSEMIGESGKFDWLYKIAEQVKRVIGYHRVMVYEFHPDGHGEVVAEARDAHLEPFLGLHYPASDIPQQARELYKVNLTRIISDIAYEPSPILSLAAYSHLPLDLTHSALRAVSPIHIEYLKNMGVASSFSISIVCRDKLWGLIACHNYLPRFINYKEREAAKLIGRVLASAILLREQEISMAGNEELERIGKAVAKRLSNYSDLAEAVLGEPSVILDAVGATGAALVYDRRFYMTGQTPDEPALQKLVAWLGTRMTDELYETNCLGAEYGVMQPVTDACGLLACRLSKDLDEYILWIRPELDTAVLWAGNPEKQANAEGRISPRKSFEVWKQTVQGKAEPWRPMDIRIAHEIRGVVMSGIHDRTGEMRVLNEKLVRAYKELSNYNSTITHDLKTPLTAVKGYSQILKLNFELGPDAVRIVDRIIHSADKMLIMIEHVLRYATIGQASLQPKPLRMGQLLQEVIQEVKMGNGAAGSGNGIVLGEVHDIIGDETMIVQAFSNLIGNAVKYSQQTATPMVQVSSEETGDAVIYAVRDNGIGIPAGEQSQVFELFARAAGSKDYAGTGVGLSITKKIVEKHGGDIWVESDGKSGSCFYIRFKNRVEA